MPSRLRRIGVKSVILLSACVLSLLLLELGVRLIFPQFDPSGQIQFIPSVQGIPPMGPPNGHFRQRKNTGDYDVQIQFNKYGFRDQKDLTQSTANDLFVVGDSFAFGWGVEQHDRFSDRLERELNRKVFNISVPTNLIGYIQLVRFAEEKGADVGNLLLTVTMENDLVYSKQEDSQKADSNINRCDIDQVKRYLAYRSSLYFLLTTIVHRSETLSRVTAKWGLLVPNVEGVRQNRLSETVLKDSTDRVNLLTRQYQTTVLIIPSRGLWVGDNRKTEELVHERFIQMLKGESIEVIDLKPHFEKNGDPLQYHFAGDGHWNARVHAMVAEVLANYFKGSKSVIAIDLRVE
jgi:hypothetical protein